MPWPPGLSRSDDAGTLGSEIMNYGAVRGSGLSGVRPQQGFRSCTTIILSVNHQEAFAGYLLHAIPSSKSWGFSKVSVTLMVSRSSRHSWL